MKRVLPGILALLIVQSAYCFPQVTDTSSLVVSSTEPANNNGGEIKGKEEKPVVPKIYEMNINTNVSNRYAKTQIASKVKNLDKSPNEVEFSVVTPDRAFISGFVMEIDGKSYKAYVQEKQEAKKTYDEAVASGRAAAHVQGSARDSNRFTVSVNVEPQSKAVFYLQYEELLQRQNGKYEIVINIHPGQPVKNMNVEVHIDESRPLKFVETPALRSGNEISTKENENLLPNAKIDPVNETSAVVSFQPDVEKQKEYAKELGTEKDNGLAGQFIVQYDVERDPSGGEVLVDGGHFVHFFAPSEVKPLPKMVIFVLDTSGSMSGIRIEQLKQAMNRILSELHENDVFSIIDFNDNAKVWNVDKVAVQHETASEYQPFWYRNEDESKQIFKNRTQQPIPSPYPANKANVQKGKQVVEKLQADGSTNIMDALKTALTIINKNHEESKRNQPIIVFLTDGEATSGETNNENIISTITELNSGKTPLFSLSFGDGADRSFLQKISLKNNGFARHIYEGADASLQLEEFYKSISSPLLSDVKFKYVDKVKEVTKTRYPILFHGGEIVVAGQIDPGFAPQPIEAKGFEGPVILTPPKEITAAPGSLERLWAYLTLKQILERRDAAENKTELTKEALDIALKYSFVSDVSSLVVVKPNETSKAVETEDASKQRQDFGGIPYYKSFPAGGLRSAVRPLSLGSPLGRSGLSFSGGAFGAGGFASPMAPMPAVYADPARRLYASAGMDFSQSFAKADFAEEILLSTPATYDATTTVEPIYNPNIPIDTLKSNLTWLGPLLHENGTITLPWGTYKSGVGEILNIRPDCAKSVLGSPGSCTLLQQCEFYSSLTDIEKFKEHFCDFEGYAGMCCPKGKRID
ncbi:unnamed protein product [Acanthoscelides obtectus]|uniref:Inter-alpha-trypsin inhibitor heavy chain H4-like n=1 Tax=Acanthoscelides obtectus TaxID=200917 RepID=A0A9P0NY96_ACAOB|nr:unnamed protein product [Acanthoscelides obtectus]CAK1666092.1 Inter-alpha-trypsin inhibitor heavy chain H4 [Acanthoscelides obtectus]